MSANSYEDLAYHKGHKIECVTYEGGHGPVNAAVECADCGVVLLDFDKPTPEDHIYVVGFVSDGGVGGFQWGYTRDEIEYWRDKLGTPDTDVTDVREVSLGTFGTYRFDGMTSAYLPQDPEKRREAITTALDERPELWEPVPGEGRNF